MFEISLPHHDPFVSSSSAVVPYRIAFMYGTSILWGKKILRPCLYPSTVVSGPLEITLINGDDQP